MFVLRVTFGEIAGPSSDCSLEGRGLSLSSLGHSNACSPLPIGGPGGPREDPVGPEGGGGEQACVLWFGPGPPDGA